MFAAITGTNDYPPKSETDVQVLAGEGDPLVVHEISTSAAGDKSCPTKTVYATIDPSDGIGDKQFAANLLAFFNQGNLLTQCPAALFVMNLGTDDIQGGYTAGRVFSGGIGHGTLEVDRGSVPAVTARRLFSTPLS